MTYSYQIDLRPVELGGGWKLRMLEDGQDVGGGVFEAGDDGYQDAIDQAEDWLRSRS